MLIENAELHSTEIYLKTIPLYIIVNILFKFAFTFAAEQALANEYVGFPSAWSNQLK